MVRLERWFWKFLLPTVLGALVLWFAWSRLPLGSSSNAGRGGARERTPPVSASLLAGTASCSARGCHGAIELALDPGQCQQNEYTQWARDPHADAYRVLFNERSQKISRLLGGSRKAHEAPCCLACHTNPRLAGLPEDSSFVQQERLFGVGCESCHGSANRWLAAHTASDWRKKKSAYPMPDLNDPAVHARICVGCHVGAPPDKEAPLRDVNHDLIAAGHPRLNFEFGAYQANMPAHWRPKKKPEGHLWAVGQIVSAQAALELLNHRAKSGSWPEFAEYDCFACHHSLAQPSWRQAGNPVGRKPGVLPWGSWYFALTDQIAGDAQELKSLRMLMQQPNPDRGQASAAAQTLLLTLNKLRAQLAGEKKDVDDLNRKRLQALVKGFSADPSWDRAEQTYLALHALNQSQGDPDVAAVLRELTPLRAFPPGFDGPNSWTRDGNARFDPKDFLARLQRLR